MQIGFITRQNTEIEENPNLMIMQYIGLKDKNGVETYKKDIVKYMENVVDGHFVEVVVVVDFDFTGVNFNYATEFEVIGNIYENPELIK